MRSGRCRGSKIAAHKWAGGVDAFKYLNTKATQVKWDDFPCDYATLSQAMDYIPNLSHS